MNVVIPMGGLANRFDMEGWVVPKQLVWCRGKRCIEWVIDNLVGIGAKHVYFVTRQDHAALYNYEELFRSWCPIPLTVVLLQKITRGAAETCLLAKSYIDNGDGLMIINSDQFIDYDKVGFVGAVGSCVDGFIQTFEDDVKGHFSYARLDEGGVVVEVREKQHISTHATLILYWRRGSDYCKYAERMIGKDVRFNNEFYNSLVFNEAIADGKVFHTVPANVCYSLGTPREVECFNDAKIDFA
jgi:NDP-sugar pyrophosphorylase family protein